MSSDLYCQL